MTIYQWVANELAPAFCRMLLHSLWLGTLAAVLAAVVIASTKKASAATRYNWLLGVLTALMVSIGITFFKELQRTPHLEMYSTGVSVILDQNRIAEPLSVTHTVSQYSQIFSSIIFFLDNHSTVMISIWFVVFFFNLLRMGLGLRYIHLIQRRKVSSADGDWMRWLREKSTELGIRKPIIFLQSELIKIPLAVGYLKPVILVPLGFLSNLSPQQVESILVHELAHIKRRDYLVNLLQSFTDSVFFFNPAFLWLSSLIRQEREKCCDDIAIRHSSPAEYIDALVAFQHVHYTGRYAMALQTKKYFLLTRVRRILSSENSKLTNWEMSLLFLGMVIMGLSFMAFQPNARTGAKPLIQKETNLVKNTNSTSAQKKIGNAVNKAIAQRWQDTLPPSKTKVKDPAKAITIISDSGRDPYNPYQEQTISIEDKIYKIRRKGNAIDYISIEGKEVPKEDYPKYASLINVIEQKKKDHANHLLELKRNLNAKDVQPSPKTPAGVPQQKQEPKKEKDINIEKSKGTQASDPVKPYEAVTSSTNSPISSIISELMENKLVNSITNLSFSLTSQQFVVNQVAQNESVFEKFKAKYLKEPRSYFTYSNDGGRVRTGSYAK